MHKAQDYYPECPEAMIVSLARTGDRNAFAELVKRRQSSVRNLMRRCCGDTTLADDLSQKVFLRLWTKIHTLKQVEAFGAWLKRLAISIWLQYLRKNDALRGASEFAEVERTHSDAVGEGMDLDHALAALSYPARLCVVLSYQEGMSHREIAALVDLPLGTVKSHIKRGAEQLRQLLSAYRNNTKVEKS